MSDSPAYIAANGGYGGSKAQAYGSGGGGTVWSYASYDDGSDTFYSDQLLRCTNTATGARGNAGTDTGSTVPVAGNTRMSMQTAGNSTMSTITSTLHFYIYPAAFTGGSDGTTSSDSAGGGGASMIGVGGNGVKQAAGTAGSYGAGGGGAGGQLIGGG